MIDVFISYNKDDEAEAEKLSAEFRTHGLYTFFAPDNLAQYVGQPGWEERIERALSESRHLAVYCSSAAIASEWVAKEIESFDKYRAGDTGRHIYVIQPKGVSEKDLEAFVRVNELLEKVLRAPKAKVLAQLTKEKIDLVTVRASDAQRLASSAFDFYKQRRFWTPLVRNGSISLLTCGRDAPLGTEGLGPGRAANGGRTNIDLWDFQTAIDITRYFAKEYPGTQVVIENPTPKRTIDDSAKRINSTKHITPLLEKDCIIVGSPDVSDFAEVALAQILNVDPYDPGCELKAGFRMIKKDSKAISTFFSAPLKKSGSQGIALYNPETNRSDFVEVVDRPWWRKGSWRTRFCEESFSISKRKLHSDSFGLYWSRDKGIGSVPYGRHAH